MPAAPQATPRPLRALGGDRVSLLTGEWSSGCKGRGGSGGLAGYLKVTGATRGHG